MDELELQKTYDRTYVQIDLEAIKHNIRCEREKVGKNVKIMAIVKANAYGHGDVEVAEALKEEVDAYGVAIIEEALKLRNTGIDKMILILGHTGRIWYKDLIENNISQAVYSYEIAKALSEEAVLLGKKAKIHIKIDTGMSRIGFQPIKDNIEVIYAISKLPGIELEGIFTHFARADEASTKWVKEPFDKFQIFCEELKKRGVDIPLAHAANSASILRFPETYLNMVRSGITTYGLYPSEEVEKNVDFHPALSWKSEVVHVKTIHAGISVSYGGTFTADKDTVIATVPVGYADGVKRDLSGKGRVLVKGCYAPIVGRICMDQFMIDVTDIPEVKVGDEVTLIGNDGANSISVEEVANLAHSFNYEYICSITERVPRKYI
ncbi:MAG: alanine racemase [Eubacterium sp.]